MLSIFQQGFVPDALSERTFDSTRHNEYLSLISS